VKIIIQFVDVTLRQLYYASISGYIKYLIDSNQIVFVKPFKLCNSALLINLAPVNYTK